MKFTVSQSALMRSVSMVSKVLVRNSTVPTLAGILVRARDGMIELQATDLNNSMRNGVAASVEEEGAAVVSGTLLQGIVKNLPDAAVSFDMREGETMLTMSCKRSKYRLHTLPVEDFPEFPEFERKSSVELPGTIITGMAEQVRRATSKDASRPILTGVLVSVSGDEVTLAATDSYRLHVSRSRMSEPCGELSAVMPSFALTDALSAAPGMDIIKVGLGDAQISLEFGTTVYVARRIDGQFPDFNRLLPAGYGTRVIVGVPEMKESLRRVSVVAKTNPSVRLDIADGELVMSAQQADAGDASESVACDTEGSPMSIAINHHYLSDALAGADGELSLQLNGPMQPLVAKSLGAVEYTFLIMPVRM